MRRSILAVSVVLALVMGASSAQAFGSSRRLARALKAILEENFAQTQKENVAGVLATIHEESPAADAGEAGLKDLFEKYNLQYELLSFDLIGTDDDYAIVRASQKTTRENGAEYSDNVIDSIYLFRKSKGAWKLWHQVMLETRIIE